MAGLYIHIPFCRRACHYCDFHFSTQSGYVADMVGSMIRELQLRKDYLGGEPLSTLYFGGGTPSLLHPDDVRRMIEWAVQLFGIKVDPEITLEANPEDLTQVYLNELRLTGVNRLSVGVQSFLDDELRALNRGHSSSQAADSIKRAQDMGFENITLDLMYALPNSDESRWRYSMNRAISLQVPHISAYCLTIEPGTYFGHLAKRAKVNFPEDPVAAAQYTMLCECMREAGYEHYEVSNFSLPGKSSRHNSGYWRGSAYMGIGPSAHSYDGTSRQWNVANNHTYMKGVAVGRGYFEREELTPGDRHNEYLITGLRTAQGISLQRLWEMASPDVSGKWSVALDEWMQQGLLHANGDALTLSEAGMLVADRLITRLMI